MRHRHIPLGVFAPKLGLSPARWRTRSSIAFEEHEIFDLFNTHDWELRYSLTFWIYQLCAIMVQERVHKRVVTIKNIYSLQHNDYIRKVLDKDCRRVADLFGIRFIVTTRAGGVITTEDTLFIHLAKHNRVTNQASRDLMVEEILNECQQMYI